MNSVALEPRSDLLRRISCDHDSSYLGNCFMEANRNLPVFWLFFFLHAQNTFTLVLTSQQEFPSQHTCTRIFFLSALTLNPEHIFPNARGTASWRHFTSVQICCNFLFSHLQHRPLAQHGDDTYRATRTSPSQVSIKEKPRIS